MPSLPAPITLTFRSELLKTWPSRRFSRVRPAGDGVAERRPDAAVHELAAVQVTLVDHHAADGAVLADLDRLDAEVGGVRTLRDLERRDLRACARDLRDRPPRAGRRWSTSSARRRFGASSTCVQMKFATWTSSRAMRTSQTWVRWPTCSGYATAISSSPTVAVWKMFVFISAVVKFQPTRAAVARRPSRRCCRRMPSTHRRACRRRCAGGAR